MLGTPQLLLPDDASPFHELAPVQPGEALFAVDTPTFRCGTCCVNDTSGLVAP